MQPASSDRFQKPSDRMAAASIFRSKFRAIQGFDRRRRRGIPLTRFCIGVVMRKIGGNHDCRFLAIPEMIQDLGDLTPTDLANNERYDHHVTQGHLDEGKLDFERMLATMRRVILNDAGLLKAEVIDCVTIHGKRSQWGFESARARRGKALEPNVVGRANEDDTPDPTRGRHERPIGSGRGRPGIDVTGVR